MRERLLSLWRVRLPNLVHRREVARLEREVEPLSCDRRTRSVTDSGSPFGFDQITSARRMSPRSSMQRRA
jgi:hypothetical protein